VSLIDASYVYEQQLSFSLGYFSKSLFVLHLSALKYFLFNFFGGACKLYHSNLKKT